MTASQNLAAKIPAAIAKPSHIKPDGSLQMVDVGQKLVTVRTACAQAHVRLGAAAADALRAATLPKGDAFVAAQLAGILAAKQTGALIPLAHSLPLSAVNVSFAWIDSGVLCITVESSTAAQTGVEMEALVAAGIAALTIYDMCKALDKGIVVENLRLVSKTGGKSGDWPAAAAVPAGVAQA